MKQNGIWIWENSQAQYDEFADFRTDFTWETAAAPAALRISADTNYAVYVNGTLAAFGQYADFPHCKVADTHDLTAFCRPGANELLITVWYHGAPSSTYQTGQAGLFFEVTAGDVLLVLVKVGAGVSSLGAERTISVVIPVMLSIAGGIGKPGSHRL